MSQVPGLGHVNFYRHPGRYPTLFHSFVRSLDIRYRCYYATTMMPQDRRYVYTSASFQTSCLSFRFRCVLSRRKIHPSLSLFALCHSSHHCTRTREARGAGRVCKCQQACRWAARATKWGSGRATSIGNPFFTLRLTVSAKRPILPE